MKFTIAARHRESRLWPLLALVVAAALGAIGCADPMARAELVQRIESGTAPPIVDVRSKAEYEESHVPGAVHVPFYSILASRERISAVRTEAEAVVLYCEHGPRAGIARAQLWMSGLGPVLFLEGHMTAWKRDGLPVETGAADRSSSSDGSRHQELR